MKNISEFHVPNETHPESLILRTDIF